MKSLPSILAAVAAVVVAHWLHRRVERVEQVSGAWRVQSPDPLARGQEAPAWDSPNWWNSDEYARALARWDRELGGGRAA